MVEKHRREHSEISIVESYRHLPQSEEDLAGLEEAAKAWIEE